MKTSFYFILWIVSYLVIDATGIPQLTQYSFFIAFVAVMAIGRLCNNLFAQRILYIQKRRLFDMYDMYYTDNPEPFKRHALKQFLFSFASFAYLAFTTCFLIYAREDIVMIGIFALIAFSMGRSSLQNWRNYESMRDLEHFNLEADEIDQHQGFLYYRAQRSTHSAEELMPKPCTADKVYRWANFAFAVVAVILGLAFIWLSLPLLFAPKTIMLGGIMYMAYGGLAVIYGIDDIISTIKWE